MENDDDFVMTSNSGGIRQAVPVRTPSSWHHNAHEGGILHAEILAPVHVADELCANHSLVPADLELATTVNPWRSKG